MRYVTGGIALGATLALGSLVGAGTSAASAAPAHVESLYAPSALVLTVGQGDEPSESGVQRAVTLTCMPKAGGTHPNAAGACEQLRKTDGDFKKITAIKDGTICTMEWDPRFVTADGVWQGKRIHFEKVFGNSCELKAGKGTVFEF
ncbi:subtilase-type protease inhibitor [Streptomyces gamaensis]|uniref:Probable subtilase-type protease inhibitor n=1 Tax=Streptomyces gamaensis TaxID=1763542 RepID=A0ABW0ZCN1_9ACTN